MSFRGYCIEQKGGGGIRLTETLGQGAFGKVKLGQHQDTLEEMAVKITNLKKVAFSNVKKEVIVHKSLHHPNIVKLIGYGMMGKENFYISMELCSGGELFDKIVPDEGMHPVMAHFCFKQLTNAVAYLIENGVVHRDIKPENILVDSFGNIKLADFGFGTVFLMNGKARQLELRCGTPPYVSPEVLHGLYEGYGVDVWSIGVILVAMIVGYLPWNEPTRRCPRYCSWLRRDFDTEPWASLKAEHREAFGLLKFMCCPDIRHRYRIEEVKKSLYYHMKSVLTDNCPDMILTAWHFPTLKRLHYIRELSIEEEVTTTRKKPKTSASDPLSSSTSARDEDDEDDEERRERIIEEMMTLKRKNALRQAWFKTSLSPRDILQVFMDTVESLKSFNGSNYVELSYAYDHLKNVVEFSIPDPHLGFDETGLVKFSARARGVDGDCTIVDFMLIQGSGMWAWHVKDVIRKSVGSVIATVGTQTQASPVSHLITLREPEDYDEKRARGEIIDTTKRPIDKNTRKWQQQPSSSSSSSSK